MKKLLPFICMLLASGIRAQSVNAVISGHLKQMKPGTWIYSQWYDTEHMALGPERFDSVQYTPSGFEIKLQVAEGGGSERVLLIGRKGGEGKGMFLYVDKGEIRLEGNDSTFKDVELSGSPFAKDLNDFHHFINGQPKLAGYDALQAKVRMARRNKDTSAIAGQMTQLRTLDSLRKSLSLQWIDQHKGSPISVYIVRNVYEPLYGKLTLDEQEALLRKLSPAALHNKLAEAMKYSIGTERSTAIGSTAPDFTQNDTLGRPVSLKNFRGKYVLVDFWASWCGPCRRENPNVVKVFKQYKDKGFTVLGVSLDQEGKKDAWLKAIHDDGLTWTQVSDLKYWNNAVAKLYDVKAVPANFLLGPDGSILGKNLRGEDLEKKLAELFKN